MVVTDPLGDVAEHAAGLAALSEQLAQARGVRDASIAAAFAHGYTISAIAAAARLTPARVSGILGHPHGRPGRPERLIKAQNVPHQECEF